MTKLISVSTDFAGEVMDVNILKKINPRALSRLVKLWVPWWISDTPNRVENLNVSKSSLRRKGDVTDHVCVNKGNTQYFYDYQKCNKEIILYR